MTITSTILKSEHRKEIDGLLNKGLKVSEVLKHFRDKGIKLSRSALYRYRNSHFIYRRQSTNRLYKILLETGNYNLLKALQRTEKIYDTKRRCRCANIRPEDLRRKGRVFLHRVCGGWYPFDLGQHLRKRNREIKPQYHKIIATARSY